MTLLCQHCKTPLPVLTFKDARPKRQAVFVWRNGVRLHIECAIALGKKTTP